MNKLINLKNSLSQWELLGKSKNSHSNLKSKARSREILFLPYVLTRDLIYSLNSVSFFKNIFEKYIVSPHFFYAGSRGEGIINPSRLYMR